MTDDNKPKLQPIAAKKRKIKIFIAICISAALLSVLYLTECFGVWSTLLTLTNVGSIYEESSGYPLVITVYDVGSANCVLVSCDGYHILIDCGMQKFGNDLSDQLRSFNIDRIDLAVLSAHDEKYIGSMCEIADNVGIDRFVTCEGSDGGQPEKYKLLLDKLNEKDVRIQYVKSGDKITLGDLSLNVLPPSGEYDTKSGDSLALRLAYGDFAMLFLGDTSKKAQTEMLESTEDIRSDVVLASRQGGWDAVSEKLLRSVDPDDVVISVEQTDYYPNDKALGLILNYGCNLYRTDHDGNIAIASDGSVYKIITQRR